MSAYLHQTLSNMDKKIKIAVSSCLLGNNVRYDGANKTNSVVQHICKTFECVAVCPESAIGLGTPRPPLQLIRIENKYIVCGKTNPNFSVTDKLRSYAKHFIERNPDICGYVFKSRSPSCGVGSTPWIDKDSGEHGLTDGMFSQQINSLLPALPVIEETELENSEIQQAFIQKVKLYAGNLSEE